MRILQAGKNYQSSEKMKKSYHLAKRQVNGSFPSRASFMDMGPEQQNRKPHSEGPALSLMLCCHHLEILNNSLTRGSMSSFWMGPHKVQFLTTWLPLGCPRFPWVPAKDWSVSQCQPTQSIPWLQNGGLRSYPFLPDKYTSAFCFMGFPVNNYKENRIVKGTVPEASQLLSVTVMSLAVYSYTVPSAMATGLSLPCQISS